MAKAIKVRNVSKTFKINPVRVDSLRQNLQRALRLAFPKKVPFLALDNISFDVDEGEVFGIIGMNGSGKSTLLKILSRIMIPTTGRIELLGKINTLLEVGTGFHPELTGRENIFLNGSILGLSRSEIRSRFDEIVDFSEVEAFLDTPVKHYSSGMFVRLAFSVAAHLDPDILIVDEVLSVGDATFQKKCIRKMEEEVLQGRTVLFVSHNMDQIRKLSKRVMLLHQGKIVEIGDPQVTIEKYLSGHQTIDQDIVRHPEQRRGNGHIRLVDIALLDNSHKKCDILLSGSEYFFRMEYTSQSSGLDQVEFRIMLKTMDGQVILTLLSKMHIPASETIAPRAVAECRLNKLPLNQGIYFVDVEIYHQSELADLLQNVFSIEVARGPFYSTGDLPPVTVPVLADDAWKIIKIE